MRPNLYADRPTAMVLAAAMACAGLSLIGASVLRPSRSNGLVIITLDTARADRLSPYGYMNAVMPGLERLAREGVVFDQAMTASPLTLPSHTTLFTGLLPPAHGVRDNADKPLAPSATTMAEILTERGYRTAAFVASAVLYPDRGLAQGFRDYGSVAMEEQGGPRALQRRGDEVTSDALEWLGGVGPEPFLLWLHLYDPHRPYDPPEPFRSRYTDPYVGELAFADAQVDRVLTALDRLHLVDRTVVIVAGDHGESLGDHGERDHGIFLYQSVLRVPLLIRAPGLTPRRIGSVVRIADVVPTVLQLLGVPAVPTDGASLVDIMHARAPAEDRESYAESLYPRRFGCRPLRALRDRRFTFIDAPEPELYDLEADPFEQRNEYGVRPSVAAAMARRLEAYGPPKAADAVPPELRQRLASLGYVATAAATGAAAAATTADPNECLSVINLAVGGGRRAATSLSRAP